VSTAADWHFGRLDGTLVAEVAALGLAVAFTSPISVAVFLIVRGITNPV
jgi:hypothetical protein